MHLRRTTKEAFLRPGGRPGLSAITEHLFVGEYPRPEDAGWLRAEHAIDAVVCLQDDADLLAKHIVPAELGAAYERAGIELHRFPVADGDAAALGARLIEIADSVHAAIERGRRVLVHCNGGYNRAPTVAIAYLCRHGGLTLEQSKRHVRERRACAPYVRALENAVGGSHR